MNRTIRVVGEKESKAIKHLELIGKNKTQIIAQRYKLKEPIYSAIFFAPMTKGKEEKLGQFLIDGKYIILNESLLENNVPQNDIDNIFLHEMAHALDYALNGSLSGHSTLFRSYCYELGVDHTFSKAKVKLSLDETKRYSSKIEKLKAMQSSPFENEAMIAIAKAHA